MELPVDIIHWSLSILPIVVLAFLLIQLRWTAQQAGAFGVFMAAALALFAFRTPLETLAVAGAKGVWDAAFILLVIYAIEIFVAFLQAYVFTILTAVYIQEAEETEEE